MACSSAICIFKNSLFKFTSHTFSFRLPLVCSLASYFASDGVICAYCLLTRLAIFLHTLSCAPCFPFTVLSLSQVSFQFYICSHSFPFWLRFFASILFPNQQRVLLATTLKANAHGIFSHVAVPPLPPLSLSRCRFSYSSTLRLYFFSSVWTVLRASESCLLFFDTFSG